MAVWCLLSLPACAGPLTQWGEETSLVWKAAAFEPAEVERERVAVLQAMVGFGLEGYAHQVSRTLAQALLGGEHTVAVMFPSQALSRINREGLAADYAGMVSEYAHSGILRREGLGKIGQALGVSYVFQPSMASFSQTISGRFSFFGLRLFQTRVTQLRLSVLATVPVRMIFLSS